MLKPVWPRMVNPCHPLMRGCVLHLPFNEGTGSSVRDLSGQNNHGTISGATWGGGKDGSALLFNGSSGFVTVSNSSELNPTAAISVIARVLRTSGWIGINVVDKPYTSHAAPYYQYALQHYDGGVSFNIDVDGTLKATTASNTPVPLGESHIIAATYDGGTLRIYRDGVETDTTVAAGSITAYATDLKIGRVANAETYFPGRIEFVYVYNRALSAGEVAWLCRKPYCMFRGR